MLVYKMVVLPLPETRAYLSSVFGACPFSLDLSKMYVEVNTSATPMEANIDAVYEARGSDLNVYYDANLGMSGLIMSLNSPELQARFRHLQTYAPHAWHRNYYPHSTLLEPMPPLRRQYKVFINSVASTLINPYTEPLYFGVETVLTQDINAPEDMEYYRMREAAGTTFMHQLFI